MVFTTLAKQLANTSPEPRYCICGALTKDNYIGGLGLDYGWNHLVPESLSRLMNISIKLLVQPAGALFIYAAARLIFKWRRKTTGSGIKPIRFLGYLLIGYLLYSHSNSPCATGEDLTAHLTHPSYSHRNTQIVYT
ncbi:uncharacterized protein K441DRAFT_41420 [Cenococcum geophilum 1.58]|uniref:uncharacterized protein n=1 Tax=Cenococcum geophilum 1.58 TaxID=794803 RepID=UPI00358DE549|nr:hypothetical protein K441DRAFT_41420 [Cenococcum geophilum 1.58]